MDLLRQLSLLLAPVLIEYAIERIERRRDRNDNRKASRVNPSQG